MSSVYVVMQGGYSPVAIVIPTPRAVFATRKKANDYVKTRRYPSEWYVRRVDDMMEGRTCINSTT